MIWIKKLTQEHVEQYFEKEGCKLLGKYKNTRTPIEYICSCGNPSKIRVGDFKLGHRCAKCGQSKKYTIDEVREYFISQNCTLLSTTYKNNHTLLKYICSCGEESEITFSMFKSGQRCWNCRGERISKTKKEISGNVSTLSDILRNKISDWKIESLKTYNYQCAITKKGGSLVIHHLYSFNKIIKETLKLLNIPYKIDAKYYNDEQLKLIENEFIKLHKEYGLGVPLTKEVHDLYHVICGYNNTLQQFEKFKNNYLSGQYDHFFISKEAI